MCKERELLKKVLATGWLDHTLSCEVEELLAQPEQEPLSDKHIAEQAVWAANNKHSFKEGVRWAEKQHGIGGE